MKGLLGKAVFFLVKAELEKVVGLVGTQTGLKGWALHYSDVPGSETQSDKAGSGETIVARLTPSV